MTHSAKISFLFLFLFTFSIAAQSPRFIQERIEVTVFDNHCSLTGTYYFANPDTKQLEKTLYYPFVISEELPYPKFINVINLSSNKNIPWSKAQEGIYFKVNISPQDTAIYQVQYDQPTLNHRMEYILTTTQQWKRPLSNAEFVIRVPIEFELTFLSYKYDKKIKNSTHNVYYFTKQNFMPDTNLIIQWAGRQK